MGVSGALMEDGLAAIETLAAASTVTATAAACFLRRSALSLCLSSLFFLDFTASAENAGRHIIMMRTSVDKPGRIMTSHSSFP